MLPRPEEIKLEIDRQLTINRPQRGDEVTSKIRFILYANLDRKRVQAYIEGEISRVGEYVEKVAALYTEVHPYLSKLQSEKDTLLWKPLYTKMLTWAYNFLLRKGFYPGQTTQDVATGCANEAAINLVAAHFPYDTAFDPWAHVIVQNACRKYIQRETRKSEIPGNSLIEIDDDSNNYEELFVQGEEYRDGSEDTINEAVTKLSGDRRQVIEWLYYNDMQPDEIAAKMGKTVGAIYSLKFNAIRDLKKILAINEDNLNV